MKFDFPTNWYSENDMRRTTFNKPVMLVEMFQCGVYGEHGKIYVRPVYYNQTGIEYYGEHTGEHILCNLNLWGQFQWKNKDKDEPSREHVYAVRLGYNDDNVFTIHNMDYLDEKYNLLKRISRKMDKIRNERGNIGTFGEHAFRFAEALGITEFVVKENGMLRTIPRRDIVRILDQAVMTNRIGY